MSAHTTFSMSGMHQMSMPVLVTLKQVWKAASTMGSRWAFLAVERAVSVGL